MAAPSALLALLALLAAASLTAARLDDSAPSQPLARERRQGAAVSFVQAGRRRRPAPYRPPSPPPPPPAASDRSGRFLPLFTVVQFANQGCAAASGDNGTCLTAAECDSRGGTASGPCAGGYGICCVFLATCGQMTSQNCTYFVNRGFPSPQTATGSCQLTINKAHPDICQYRLDFDQFVVAGPEAVNHVCSSDQFIVSGGGRAPAICGTNTGNHMYVDAGAGPSNPVTLTMVTSGPSLARTWKIKVCQIPCSALYRADDGCTQFFTGVSGQIKSYNYDPGAGLQLSNQDYSSCVRAERNFCGIQYSSCPDPVNNRTQAFTLTGNTRQGPVAASVGTLGPNSCTSDWLIIPCASNVGRVQPAGSSTCVDRLCGGTFNTEAGSLTPSAVVSTVRPFRLVYHTNSVEAPADVGNRGFCLNYVQQPCSNNLA
ncbi:uncharacterized protein LOC134538576 [Bacillus rossius redtenbacheri]|uniref:uncharacterized protein LOC134538576 n=1 Tax=Bacillus rossius redtenbacheri TaxID=93214 RepID=UPI002FDE3E6B